MNKKQAKYIFRGTANLAEAFGITRQAIHQWPEELPQRLMFAVIGAATIKGISIDYPEDLK